jgi:hypothetical protein
MFFFFGGRNLPPGLRRFLIGLSLGSVALFLFQIAFLNLPLSWLSAGLVVLFAAWYAQRSLQAEDDKRFNRRRAGQRQSFEPMYREEFVPIVERPTPAQEAAERALRRAGHNPDTIKLKLHDIGLMVYRGAENPATVARLEAVRSDATHLRPYMKLHSPLPKELLQEVTFEVWDDAAEPRFRNAGDYEVRPGMNIITPKNWMRVPDDSVQGNWEMRILLGTTLLASHQFRWRKPSTQAAPINLTSDGELEDAASRLADRPMSLDELLSDQGDESPKKAQNSRKQ